MSTSRIVVWDNWAHSLPESEKVSADEDHRTSMYCLHDAYDLDSLINYTRLCSRLRSILRQLYAERETDQTKPAKIPTMIGPDYMFDLGFIPVNMTPSYWEPAVTTGIITRIQESQKAMPKEHQLPIFTRKYLGMSDAIYKGGTSLPTEWWVSKLDLARLTGKSIFQIGLREVFDYCGITTL